MMIGPDKNYGLLLLWGLLVYLVAAIPFGVIVSRLVVGQDVRAQGSGNIGATNVARLMGKKWGVIVLVLDALKGFFVVFIPLHLLTPEVYLVSFVNLCGAIAVFAHCYPVYLKFKGGKGVATALGVILALSPLTLAIAFTIFVLTLILYRRVSVASLLAALAVPVAALLIPTTIFPATAAFIAAIVWWKHRENIKRIVKGTEPRFF